VIDVAEAAKAFNNAFCRWLEDTSGYARHLATLLESERVALVTRNAHELEHLTAQKRHSVACLEIQETRRKALMQHHGYGTDIQDITDYLRTRDAHDGPKLKWEQLIRLLHDCQHNNRINGAILNAKRHCVERAIHILQGENSETTLYTPSGRQTNRLQSRSRAKI
jgi:flagellar biosynthesis/type III secretory pathway chaperone